MNNKGATEMIKLKKEHLCFFVMVKCVMFNLNFVVTVS